MREHALHACDFLPLADGNYRAVTVRNLSDLGFMVWAGALRPCAIGKPADEIQPDDYAYMESVGFHTLGNVWEYFGSREYSVLIADLRHQAGATAAVAADVDRDLSLEAQRVKLRPLGWIRLLSTRARALQNQPSPVQRSAKGI